MASFAESHERLGKPTALAVLASDAISSTAYAGEEILRVLVPVVALAALEDLIPIAVVVCILLLVVISSYRQTIHAYPNGGGSYVVSKENLGITPALVAVSPPTAHRSRSLTPHTPKSVGACDGVIIDVPWCAAVS